MKGFKNFLVIGHIQVENFLPVNNFVDSIQDSYKGQATVR